MARRTTRFLDSSTNNFTITRNGNTTQGSLSPYGNLWSNYFSSTSTDFLSLPSNTATNLSNSNFTFEAWFNKVGNPAQAVNLIWWNGNSNNSSHSGLRIQLNNDRTISLLCSETGSSWQISTSSTAVYADFAWNHVAAVRNGQTVTVYLNGVSVCSGSLSSSTASLYAGTLNYINNMAYTSGTWKMVGYVSNLRLVKGTALYTSNFTPSTTPLTAVSGTSLLTCQSNRFIDNSANNFTITPNGDVRVTKEAPFLPTAAYSTSTIGGSGYFDGTGDYLTAPDNAAFNFGSGDFTVEMWLYPTALGQSGYTFIYLKPNASGYSGVAVLQDPSSYAVKLYSSSAGSSWDLANGATIGTLTPNAWNHVAVSRSGTNMRAFLNGALGSTTAVSTSSLFSTTNPVYIGSSLGNSNTFYTGHISNLRVVKGTAIYTAAFTPPTAPVTAITNTSLLLNFTNAGIFDNAAENVLETVGNTQISTSVKKYGTGSLAFDGNNDMLFMPYTPSLALKGTYTIEAWIYPTSTSAWRQIFTIQAALTSNFGAVSFACNGATLIIEIRPTTGGAITSVTGGTVVANTWQHVAFSVSAGSAKLFLNGTQVGSTTTVPDFSFTPIGVGIGNNANGWNSTSESFLGYIDDLRITKGYARYTSNFTPPTAAFPDQ